jgi:REP element-mobilizing transposase RayT
MGTYFDGYFPPAYFITFTTYGTRLHGDERGSVNRWHNRFGEPALEPRPGLEEAEFAGLKSPPVVLDAAKREATYSAIRERCAFKEWELHALNVRTNHVHAVVSAQERVELVMNSFKARATRAMRERGLIAPGLPVWTRHGSTRLLWNQKQIEGASVYVIDGQGPDLPGV